MDRDQHLERESSSYGEIHGAPPEIHSDDTPNTSRRGIWSLTEPLGRGIWSLTEPLGRGIWSLTEPLGRGIRGLTEPLGRGIRSLTEPLGRGDRNLAEMDETNQGTLPLMPLRTRQNEVVPQIADQGGPPKVPPRPAVIVPPGDDDEP